MCLVYCVYTASCLLGYIVLWYMSFFCILIYFIWHVFIYEVYDKGKVDILPSNQLPWFLTRVYLDPGSEPVISRWFYPLGLRVSPSVCRFIFDLLYVSLNLFYIVSGMCDNAVKYIQDSWRFWNSHHLHKFKIPFINLSFYQLLGVLGQHKLRWVPIL